MSVTSPCREQALLLGARQSLVGVLTHAADAAAAATRPTVVLLNAGIIHRVGPNRLHVTLARALAAQGRDVLRFDLSAIGDSAARGDTLPPLEAALADIREVLDWLESTRRVRRVVLMGLCSGADHALLYASNDPRVAGIGLLDASIPRTPGYFVRHWRRRLLSPKAWLSLLSGQHGLLRRVVAGMRREQGEAPAAETLTLESPQVRAALEDAYRRTLAHGARILAVFTGTAGREYRLNYREQMLDAFPGVPFGDRLRLEYFKDADHTFSAERHREALVGLVIDWVASLDASNGSTGALAASLAVGTMAFARVEP